MAKVKQYPKVEASINMLSIPHGSFGDQPIFELTPYITGSAEYGLIPANFREYTTGTGTTGTENQMFKVGTGGTGTGAYGAIQSFRALNHKPGFGALARFSAIFEGSSANSWQGVGLLNLGDEMSFGYNGTSFLVWVEDL